MRRGYSHEAPHRGAFFVSSATFAMHAAHARSTLVHVFCRDPRGGNPAQVTLADADTSPDTMQAAAAAAGCETVFVLPAEDGSTDWRLRFFAPRHEMDMCGHATVGALWVLRQAGRWQTDHARLQTASGTVHARWDDGQVWISQPAAHTQAITDDQRGRIASLLRVDAGQIGVATWASTSRPKTLVALPDVATLDALQPDFPNMAAGCAALDSTGLYPYAPTDDPAVWCARQFPANVGYAEDAATGVAAAALWGWLTARGAAPIQNDGHDATLTIRQGEAMGAASAIHVRPRRDPAGNVDGCWLGGQVVYGQTP